MDEEPELGDLEKRPDRKKNSVASLRTPGLRGVPRQKEVVSFDCASFEEKHTNDSGGLMQMTSHITSNALI